MSKLIKQIKPYALYILGVILFVVAYFVKPIKSRKWLQIAVYVVAALAVIATPAINWWKKRNGNNI